VINDCQLRYGIVLERSVIGSAYVKTKKTTSTTGSHVRVRVKS